MARAVRQADHRPGRHSSACQQRVVRRLECTRRDFAHFGLFLRLEQVEVERLRTGPLRLERKPIACLGIIEFVDFWREFSTLVIP